MQLQSQGTSWQEWTVPRKACSAEMFVAQYIGKRRKVTVALAVLTDVQSSRNGNILDFEVVYFGTMNNEPAMRYLIFLPLLFLSLIQSLEAQDSGIQVTGRGGMVVSASPQATDVGIEILRRGGNAVDAAVAVGFALAVTYPSAGNLGGGSYLLIRMADGRDVAIDARETAPRSAHRDMFLDKDGRVLGNASLYGPLAAGVPGSVDGLLTALSRYGSMDRKVVIAPALRLARNGFVPHKRLHALMTSYADSFRIYPSTEACYLPGGTMFQRGKKWRQPELALTLERISQHGKDGFYKGKTADLIVEAMRRDGGIISHEDLAAYSCIEREPLRGSYRDYDILTMPPSSSGGVALLQMLGLLKRYKDLAAPKSDARTAHLMTEAMRRAFADRAVYLGDPAFVRMPIDSLLSSATMQAWAAGIDTALATPSTALHHRLLPAREGEQTTHYVVLDNNGNAVSVTTTINSNFGGLYIVRGTGMLLNNEMDDFSAKPGVANQFGLLGSEANSIVPGKRMLSSMTPTIVLRDGKPWLLTGSPGGSKIITSVLQTIMNMAEFGMTLPEALKRERFHHQWYPDRIEHERGAFDDATAAALSAMGHRLVQVPGFGRVEGIIFDEGTRTMHGCSDPRGYGRAAVLTQ